MLCPAAVSAAAAAAVLLLAVLGPVLSLPAEDDSEEDFSLCSHSFYRQTPPQGASAGPLLRPLCHRLPGGQTFATLSKPTCDTAVYSAFHLSHGGAEAEGEGEEGEEPVSQEEDTESIVPPLLRGAGDLSAAASPTDSPLHHWDSTVTTLVQSSLSPQCSTLGGDLFILTGAGDLRLTEDGDNECQTQPLWSAVCCTVPEGKSGFSVGLIRKTDEGASQVSVKELEEILGVAELFSEGCGGADGEMVGFTAGLSSEGLPGNLDVVVADLTAENTEEEEEEEEEEAGSNDPGQTAEEEEGGSDTTSQESNEDTEESIEAEVAGDQVAGVDAQPEEADRIEETETESWTSATSEESTTSSSSATSEDSATSSSSWTASRSTTSEDSATPSSSATSEDLEDSRTSSAESATPSDAAPSERSDEQQSSGTQSRSVTSGSSESAAIEETVEDEQTDTNSSSTLVYLLSTAMSIMKAPLRPVFSTITELPGQVSYVLQEDLGVLSALPGDTFSVFYLLTSDILSWMGSAGDLLLGVGENCFCNAYYCTSSLMEALYNSCYTGVTGVGTLAGDTWGVFGGAVDNAWWVTKFFGGRLWEQSEGYVGTVVSEMGGQVKTVGGGFGNLAWRSGNGVGNVFRVGGGIITGIVDIITGAVRGAFGDESD